MGDGSAEIAAARLPAACEIGHAKPQICLRVEKSGGSAAITQGARRAVSDLHQPVIAIVDDMGTMATFERYNSVGDIAGNAMRCRMARHLRPQAARACRSLRMQGKLCAEANKQHARHRHGAMESQNPELLYCTQALMENRRGENVTHRRIIG